MNGDIAQKGEHLPCKQEVGSSNLLVSTTREEKLLDSIFALQYGRLAQPEEQTTVNRPAKGSNPLSPAKSKKETSNASFVAK